MRTTTEILRQKRALKRSHGAIARSVGVSAGVFGSVMARAKAAGITSWAEVEVLDEAALDAALYRGPGSHGDGSIIHEGAEPHCTSIHRERSRVGVTLHLLHDEYRQHHPEGLRLHGVLRSLPRVACPSRARHAPGPRRRRGDVRGLLGQAPAPRGSATGEVIELELFVAVLGASNFTYSEATRSQRGPDWIASHFRALEFFGGFARAFTITRDAHLLRERRRAAPVPHRFPSVYRRASRLFDELALARADGMFGFVVGSARGFDALVEFYVARSKEGADSRIRQLKRPTAGGPAASLAGDERPTPDPCP